MCSFFLRGKCKNTYNCKFKHERPANDKSNVPVCPYWARRECRYGEGCLFKHLTDDVEVLTERYNAQLLQEASHGLQYVYDPTTGTTYPVQATSEYAPAHQYYQPSVSATGPTYSTVPGQAGPPLVPCQSGIPVNQQYVAQSSIQGAEPVYMSATSPSQYQSDDKNVYISPDGSRQYPPKMVVQSQGAPQVAPGSAGATCPQGRGPKMPPMQHLAQQAGETLTQHYAQPKGGTFPAKDVDGISLQEEHVNNSGVVKRKREIEDGNAGKYTTVEEQPEKRRRLEQ